DNYPEGIDPAGDSIDDAPKWLARELNHRCDTCKSCPHKFEAGGSRIRVTVRDRDGWHRLFWAGAETYTYDDPAFLAGALRNRTSELVDGRWRILATYVPVENHPPHACTPVAKEIDLRYVLRRGPFPGPGDPVIDPSGTLPVPQRMLWFRFPYPPDRVDDFWWELENPDTFAGAATTVCTCEEKTAK
ncbi:MAG TPA: hypothetical protein VJU16_09425, partial [Planctomycetota bacterium]|nr:hypothetical protein [Planctomycetota bacterium]